MTETKKFEYPNWAKIPKDYDFSNKNINWSSLSKDYLLRTDAVWEKSKLLDFYRLYYKIFDFNKSDKTYRTRGILNLIWNNYFESKNVEDDYLHEGYTPNGRTCAFETT